MPGFSVMGSTSRAEAAQLTESATSLHSQASGQNPSELKIFQCENILVFCLKIFQPRQEEEEEEGGDCGDHLKYTRFRLNIIPAQSSEGQSRAYNPIAR